MTETVKIPKPEELKSGIVDGHLDRLAAALADARNWAHHIINTEQSGLTALQKERFADLLERLGRDAKGISQVQLTRRILRAEAALNEMKSKLDDGR